MTLAKLKLRKSGTETFVLCILSTSRFQDVFVVVFLGTKRKNLGGGAAGHTSCGGCPKREPRDLLNSPDGVFLEHLTRGLHPRMENVFGLQRRLGTATLRPHEDATAQINNCEHIVASGHVSRGVIRYRRCI